MFLFEHFRVAKNTGYHTKLMTEPDPINDRFLPTLTISDSNWILILRKTPFRVAQHDIISTSW